MQAAPLSAPVSRRAFSAPHIAYRRAVAARDFDPLRGLADPQAGARRTVAVRRDPARTDTRPRGRFRVARGRYRPRRGDRAGARRVAAAIPGTRPPSRSALSRTIRIAAIDPALPRPVRGGADRRRIVRRSAAGARETVAVGPAAAARSRIAGRAADPLLLDVRGSRRNRAEGGGAGAAAAAAGARRGDHPQGRTRP